jgi:hypothetical protein
MTIDPQTLRGNWNFPTDMRFGPGRISELADACRALGMTRPLLATDPGLKDLPMGRTPLPPTRPPACRQPCSPISKAIPWAAT